MKRLYSFHVTEGSECAHLGPKTQRVQMHHAWNRTTFDHAVDLQRYVVQPAREADIRIISLRVVQAGRWFLNAARWVGCVRRWSCCENLSISDNRFDTWAFGYVAINYDISFDSSLYHSLRCPIWIPVRAFTKGRRWVEYRQDADRYEEIHLEIRENAYFEN